LRGRRLGWSGGGHGLLLGLLWDRRGRRVILCNGLLWNGGGGGLGHLLGRTAGGRGFPGGFPNGFDGNGCGGLLLLSHHRWFISSAGGGTEGS
jgi:hypothetical protein